MSGTVLPLRQFSGRPESEIDIIHSPFYPDEIFSSKSISAVLVSQSSDGLKELELPVWRISPLGIELLMPSSMPIDLAVGNRVNLRVRIAQHSSEFSGLIVASRHRDHGRELIGIRWYSPDAGAPTKQFPLGEKRKAERWLCGVDFLPTGIAPNPVRFNDFIHFRVRDLSLDGMQLYTSLRNKQLIPGMPLNAVVSLPMTGEVRFRLQITNTRILTIDGRDYLSLGTRIQDNDPRHADVLGQYIFQFGPNTSVKDLQAKGFRISAPSQAMEFGYVRTAEEYKDVLALRALAYSGAGKMAANCSIESAADIFDTRARILTARHRGQLVASARLMFHNPEDQMEHEQFVTFPDNFPRKEQIAELTRICTHPSFRGSDLFFAITKHIMLTVAQSNRTWILGSAEPKLCGAYTRLGYKHVGIQYRHADLGDISHEVLLGNVNEMLSGKNVDISLWNELYSGLSGYLKLQEMVEFDPFMNFRMNMYKALGPLTRIVTRSLRNPRSQKTPR